MDQKNLADLYGLDPIPWSRALEALESTEPQTQSSFIATTRPDGRPHVAGVGALWDQGKVYFVSGAGTRKSRNVAENAHCAIGMSLTGIDVVVEGVAERVTDDETLQRLAKRYADQGWAPTVKDGAFTHADHGLRGAGGRARRCHPLALRHLTTARTNGGPGASAACSTRNTCQRMAGSESRSQSRRGCWAPLTGSAHRASRGERRSKPAPLPARPGSRRAGPSSGARRSRRCRA